MLKLANHPNSSILRQDMELLLGALAEAMFGVLLADLAQHSRLASLRDKLRGTTPETVALQRALAASYRDFAQSHPFVAHAFFDEHFLMQEAVVNELSKLLTPHQLPNQALLEKLWRSQLRKEHNFNISGSIDFFINSLKSEVKAQPSLRPFVDSRALDQLYIIATRSDDQTLLQHEIASLLKEMRDLIQQGFQTIYSQSAQESKIETTRSNSAPLVNYLLTQQQEHDATKLSEALSLLAALPIDEVPHILSDVQTLPTGSRVKNFSPNPHFVGRETTLCEIAKVLKTDRSELSRPIAVIAGIGGMGKTQLAIEFIHRYGQFFAGGVFWLNFATPEAISSEVADCGGVGRLNLYTYSSGLSIEEQVRLVQSAWESPLPRLLVFDNCEDEALLAKWSPLTGGSRIIVTSRRAIWDPTLNARTISLSTLTSTESVSVLRRFRPDVAEDNPVFAAIATELDGLPLALHLAGSYLQRYPRATTPEAYLAQLRSPKLLDHPSMQSGRLSPTGHVQHIGRTFTLSYEQLESSKPNDALAIDLLARAARFAPSEPLPRQLLMATIHLPVEDAKFRIEDALERLIALGLIESGLNYSLKMHRLLAIFVQNSITNNDAQTHVERVLINAAHTLNKTGGSSLLSITECRTHLVHVTNEALEQERQLASALCNELAYYSWRIRDYLGGLSYAQRALDIQDQQANPNPSDLGRTHDAFGTLLQAQGKYIDAQSHYETALRIREQFLGSSHQETAESINNLGYLLHSRGKYAQALKHYQYALVIREQVIPPADFDIAQSLRNIALLLREQKKYAKALPFCERALDMYMKTCGLEHVDTATCLDILGSIHQAQGMYERAREFYERALEIWHKVLIDGHPDIALSLNNLASLYQTQAEYSKARDLYEQALIIRQEALGTNHLDTAVSLNNLANVYQLQGEIDKARTLYEKALAICQERKLHRRNLLFRQIQKNIENLKSVEQPFIIDKRPDSWGMACACPYSSPSPELLLLSPDNFLMYHQEQQIIAVDKEYSVAFIPSLSHVVVLNQAAIRTLLKFREPRKASDLCSDDIEIVQKLYQHGLLRSNLNPINFIQPPDELIAWLHVTNACNLRCSYCYIKKTNEHMSPEVATTAIDSVIRSAEVHNYRKVQIKYAGGEATLNLDLVEKTQKYALSQATTRDIALRSMILSNGVSLTIEKMERLRDLNIYLMVSLDGLQNFHDAQRPTINGKGSFATVIDNIDRAKDVGVDVIVSITVTGQSIFGLPEIVDFLLSKDIRFSINFYRENKYSMDKEKLKFEEQCIIEGLRATYHVIERRLPRYSLLDCLLDRVNIGVPHNHACAVGEHYLVIDHHGQIAKCQMEIESPVTNIWAHDPLSIIRLDQVGVQNLPVDQKEGCRDCQWRYWCSGGCAVATFRATGRYDIQSPNCTIYKALYPDVIRLEALRLLHWYRQS